MTVGEKPLTCSESLQIKPNGFFSELKRTRYIERKADRYCVADLWSAAGAKQHDPRTQDLMTTSSTANKRTSEIVFQMNTDFDIVLTLFAAWSKEGKVFGEVGHTVRGTGAFVTWTKASS